MRRCFSYSGECGEDLEVVTDVVGVDTFESRRVGRDLSRVASSS